jgi:hypothetical protein
MNLKTDGAVVSGPRAAARRPSALVALREEV